MEQVARTKSASGRTVGRLVLWAVLTLVPLAGYAAPLMNAALADTPIADMVWIPILAVAWGAWMMARTSAPQGDREADALGGFLLAGCVGLALVVGMALWPYSFVGNSEALLLWPVWGLAMAWMLFGTGVTRVLAWPMAYLLLAWPPVLTWFAGLSQGLLVRGAVVEVNVFARLVSWVRIVPPAGTYLVQHGPTLVPVQLSNACSGADSVVAVLIVLPLILTQMQGPWIRKLVLIAAAVVAANVLNLLRLVIILAATHYTGPGFAFDVVHPMLGFVLFALLVAGIFPAANMLGLGGDSLQLVVMPAAPVGWLRIALSAAMASAVFILVLPVGAYALGAQGRPFVAKSDNLATMAAPIPGFRRQLLGVFNDSAILGLGATSNAYGYFSTSGAYLQAEIWQTPSITDLNAYTFHNCLLFHGSQILSERSFSIAPGEYATAYRVLLPPSTPGARRYEYEDVEWTTAMRYHGQVLYLRVALSTLPGPASVWRGLYRPVRTAVPHGVEAMSAPPTFGAWPGQAGPILHVLEAMAIRFNVRMQARAGTTV